MSLWSIVLLVAGCYLLGSVPFGMLVGRALGFDPRTVGSGNIGMTNVARAGGTAAAALTFSGDFLKGLIPVLVVRLAGLGPVVVALAGLAAFGGAIFSVFLGFHGGRGVSTSFGVWVAIAPPAVGICFAIFLLLVAVSRIVSLASIGAALALPPTVAAMSYPRAYLLLAIVMAALVLVRHWENIDRLMRGKELPLPAARARKR